MADDYGLADLSARMEALSYGLQRKILMSAVRKGAAVIVAEASARAPRLDPKLSTARRFSGALAAGIMSRIWDSSTAEVTARIGPEKSTFWGLYSELGTVHEPAKPFLRPALDERQAEALAVIGAEIMSGIEDELA